MKRLAWLLVAALVLPVSGAWAQAYPTKPVTMIVPFAAGGPTDVIARIVGEYMSKSLGQQVVIENVAGAKQVSHIGPQQLLCLFEPAFQSIK